MAVRYIPKQLTNCKYTCKKCGKKFFYYNIAEYNKVCKRMLKEHICWECAYWENIIKTPPENMEIIGNQCYQIFPYIDTVNKTPDVVLGGKGKIRYLLKHNDKCIKSNDVWLIGTIPPQFQSQLSPTGWWVTNRYYNSLKRSNRKCYARACMDRYHCYRYKYQIEFEEEPLNYPPLDWEVGNEHCPAFLPLREIKGYDEYVKPSDIIDESSVSDKIDLKL